MNDLAYLLLAICVMCVSLGAAITLFKLDDDEPTNDNSVTPISVTEWMANELLPTVSDAELSDLELEFGRRFTQVEARRLLRERCECCK